MEETPEFSPNKEEEAPTVTPSPSSPDATAPTVSSTKEPTPLEQLSAIMEEKKVTLPVDGKRIIVDFSDKEECVLGPSCEVTFHEGTGVLTIENPGMNESLWNINIELAQTEAAEDLRAGNYLASDLDAGKEWKKPYKLMSRSPILQLKEAIDTDFKDGATPDFARHSLLFGAETSTLFQLTVTNRHQKPINKITLKKQMSDQYEFPPRLLVPYLGEVEFDVETKTVTWLIPDLASEKPATLSIVATCNLDTIEPVKSGMVEANYAVFGSNIMNIQPTIRTLCDVFFFVETAESDEPALWHCTAEYEGNSEFQTVLEAVTVSTDAATALSVQPNEVIAAKESWTADFQVKGEKPPIFQKELVYSVPWVVKRSISSNIKKRTDLLPVIKTESTKTFDPPIVNTYARTLVNTESSVTNVGSAPIDKVTFFDGIPGYFKLADDCQPQIFLDEEDVTQLAKIEFVEETELEEEKILKATVTELFDRYGGMKLDQRLSLRYILEAAKPVPGRHYEAPLRSEVFANPPATIPAVSEARTAHGSPEIEIKYEKRAIGVGKAVRKTPDGRFQVRIRVKNNGGVPLESIVVTDRIPRAFEYEDVEPKTLDYSETAEGDFQTIKWHIPRLDSEQSLTLGFKAQGKLGEYVQSEPIVEVQG